jgi:ribosomal protein S18 acetylase RimI-like enzyme
MAVVREITADEVDRLRPCLQDLAAYHNKVSLHFKGAYPRGTDDDRLIWFKEDLDEHKSLIGVVEEAGEIAGFCKLNFAGTDGTLDILIVLGKYRGRGFGKLLMDWAIASFQKRSVKLMMVKVVAGNPAIKLYEKYGFQLSSMILWRNF